MPIIIIDCLRTCSSIHLGNKTLVLGFNYTYATVYSWQNTRPLLWSNNPVWANPLTNPDQFEGLVNQIRETVFTTVTASKNLASWSSSTPSPPNTQTSDSLLLAVGKNNMESSCSLTLVYRCLHWALQGGLQKSGMWFIHLCEDLASTP